MNVKINNIIKIYITKKKLNKKSCKKRLNKKSYKKRLNKISYKKKHYGGANSQPIQEDLKTLVTNVLKIDDINDITMTRGIAEFKLNTIDCILRYSLTNNKLVLSYVKGKTKIHEIIQNTKDLQTKLIDLNIINIYYHLPPEKENYNCLIKNTRESILLLNTDEYILRYDIPGVINI